MYRDNELPNGFQDADFEMQSLQASGNRSSALRRRGICDHGWLMAPDFQPAKCMHCGKIFPNAEAAYAERAEIHQAAS